MRAVQINSYGGIDVLEINQNAISPQPGQNEVLIEVYAASLNPIDYKIRRGYLKDVMPVNFPITLGGDFAGVIKEMSEGVDNFKVGDQVFGQASGSFAQEAVANVNKIAIKPQNLNDLEAAALPLTGISALQALEDHINLQPGQKILVHGGAGGIGTIAIQLAKAIGAYVATTVSADDISYVKHIGADEVINYKEHDFSQELKDYDAVFDTVGRETTDKSFLVLKKGGILVSMLGQPNTELAQKYEIKAIGQGTESNPDRLKRLTKWVEGGKIKPHIDTIFSLEEIKDAFKHLEQDHLRGKVVLKIKN